MCDTMVKITEDSVWFAKNSDRDVNEGQNLVWIPGKTIGADSTVKCTHIDIPEVASTHAVLLSQPFWMWGAEMGTNEHGVVIGNEAVFTTAEYEETPGLIGMDLLRLGLERAASASEAVEVITSLLERHGQGGPCSFFDPKFRYHNSFIIADPTSAFVLETAGREWAVEEVRGARSISNGLTIPEFAGKHSDVKVSKINECTLRQSRTQELARVNDSVFGFMQTLQDHGSNDEHPNYKKMNGAMAAPCMHAGGETVNSQTTASWISHLSPDSISHWATGTAAPCVSLFKPVSVREPVILTKAGDRSDDSLWWRHENFHRKVLKNPERYRPLFIEERNTLQQQWVNDPPTSEEAFEIGKQALDSWTENVLLVSASDLRPAWARTFWKKQNIAAGIR